MSWQNTEIVKNKKPVFGRLLEYGFAQQGGRYAFAADIMSGTFRLNIYVSDCGVTQLEVIDNATAEEYMPVGNDSATGAFVGQVRSECEARLRDVVSKCYETEIFKSEYAGLVIEYIRREYGAAAEFLWEKFPNNAIFRDAKTQKWYGALLTVELRKLGVEKDGTVEILDLREFPENISAFVDNQRYFPGYHMNKKHWYTVLLDGSVPIEEIYRRIDASFDTLLNITVRDVTENDDLAAVSRIYAESWRNTYKGLIPQSCLDKIADDAWVPLLARKNRYSLVIERAGQLIGTASYGEARKPDLAGWGEVYAIYLLPKYTRHGYGRRLLKQTLSKLRTLGYQNAFLMVLENNAAARNFYESAGFTLEPGFVETVIGGQPVRELRYNYELSKE